MNLLHNQPSTVELLDEISIGQFLWRGNALSHRVRKVSSNVGWAMLVDWCHGNISSTFGHDIYGETAARDDFSPIWRSKILSRIKNDVTTDTLIKTNPKFGEIVTASLLREKWLGRVIGSEVRVDVSGYEKNFTRITIDDERSVIHIEADGRNLHPISKTMLLGYTTSNPTESLGAMLGVLKAVIS